MKVYSSYPIPVRPARRTGALEARPYRSHHITGAGAG
jgi:hypothetical protein